MNRLAKKDLKTFHDEGEAARKQLSAKWFEDWHIAHSTTSLDVRLPNSFEGEKNFSLKAYQSISRKKLQQLCGILMSAFDQIQQDNGGFKK